MTSTGIAILFLFIWPSAFATNSSCARDPHKDRATFSTVEDQSGNVVCALGAPNVSKRVRSRLECLVFCQNYAECVAFNWRKSRWCEMYSYNPDNLAVEEGCQLFAPGFGSIRLVDGDDNSGRLEISLDNTWTTVHQINWTTADSNVACRQLGFSEGQQTTNVFNRTSGQHTTVSSTNVACLGNEGRLGDCDRMTGFRYNGSHVDDVFLLCYDVGDACSVDSCKNGGTRLDNQNGYSCMCSPGFTLSNCQLNIDECLSGPCQHGGTCTDGINMYTCSCAPGWTGVICQININECASYPCLYGGTCLDRINQYTCSCVYGTAGTQCQTNIDECASNPCSNGGTCYDYIGYYTCGCSSRFYGTYCQNTGCFFYGVQVDYNVVGSVFRSASSLDDCKHKCTLDLNCHGVDWYLGSMCYFSPSTVVGSYGGMDHYTYSC